MYIYIDASAGLHSDRPAPGEVRLVSDPLRQQRNINTSSRSRPWNVGIAGDP